MENPCQNGGRPDGTNRPVDETASQPHLARGDTQGEATEDSERIDDYMPNERIDDYIPGGPATEEGKRESDMTEEEMLFAQFCKGPGHGLENDRARCYKVRLNLSCHQLNFIRPNLVAALLVDPLSTKSKVVTSSLSPVSICPAVHSFEGDCQKKERPPLW